QEYSGTVLIVSHDRTFLDNVVTQSIVFEGDGKLTEIVGGYADWQAWKAQQAKAAQQPASARPPAAAASPKPAAKSSLSYKEARELEALPVQIQALEAEQEALAARLADPTLYQDQPQEVAALHARTQAIEAELLGALARWEALEAKQAG
ncbi:MAG: ABC transporter ATP-binding protein, partial [Betaproteobacteria bacterium HGW-Betaproteobacteria-17]